MNPVSYSEQVVTSFLRYQQTTYALADSGLREKLRRLLSIEESRQSPLLRGPYISLSRAFRMGSPITDLIAKGILHPGMRDVVSFPSVYGHQERAVREIVAGRTTVVSTGTGSGKTECFLYPIISRCLQLRDQGAPAGIVAVLVYPMNALAEDQLTRLRDLLAGTGISFGMYVGKTPQEKAQVSGKRLAAGASRADYRAAVEQATKEKHGTAVHPAEERCSREEMRAKGGQPRILLTNAKQLELLLTRQADIEMFDGALLEYLVYDEAHTASGITGAEIACLIRRLKSFCGREGTVCVATSATIADPREGPEAARSFAGRFFGVEKEQVSLVTEEYEDLAWEEKRTVSTIRGEAATHLHYVLQAVEGDLTNLQTAVRAMTGISLDPKRMLEDLYERLSANEVVYQLAEALRRPRALPDLLKDVGQAVGREMGEDEALIWLVLGAAASKNGRPFLRPIVHAFVRGVGGAVVSFPGGDPVLDLSIEEKAAREGDGSIALPVLACTTCGQHYYVHHLQDYGFTGKDPEGGEAHEGTWFWRKYEETAGGKRAVLTDRIVAMEDEEDVDLPDKAREVFLCRACGTLHPEERPTCAACERPGALVRLLAIRSSKDDPGYIQSCISCKAPGRKWGGGYREPARPIRAVAVSDVHVLAQNMLQHAERKRLLIFADNRQDAAFQAGWMQDHARRFRLRALMAEKIAAGSVSVGDLVHHLSDRLEKDDELSRLLIPEVWQQYRKEAAGVKHAEERDYFLRIQVLREIATGVKQRIGLEPWGRMKVAYLGLGPELGFVRRWAETLGLEPERLADGIAGLLDMQRRGFHLLDRGHEIFSRYWQEGDREVQRGYMPMLRGVPKGLKLTREGGDDPGRVTQWWSARGDTTVRQAVRGWGVDPDRLDVFVRELWGVLEEEVQILAPVTLRGAKGRALPGCSGVRQIDADRILLTPTRGLWRCRKCRRAQVRSAPHDRCLAWRCDGTLQFEAEDPDNYDLAVLDGGFTMVRAREHSAQVPAEDREYLERAFKGEGESVNTLVCTPTLELGVDIGALDVVLMRNVPPLPANYWQRAGRAGRRHRMAAILTYARPVAHDKSYIADPLKMLDGAVEPPRFNMKNELMIAQHVHASVLTRLWQIGRQDGGVADALRAVLPGQVKDYLFDAKGNVRAEVYDVGPLRRVVAAHEANLIASVGAVFGKGWPEEDREAVAAERLASIVKEMPERLEGVVRSLRKRLEWALGQMRRLDEVRRQRGTLEADDDALFKRCDRLVKRLKGLAQRERREVEGYDDTNTYGVLAAEGFLPGYGLEIGSIRGTAQVPQTHAAGRDFELPRPPAVALREYVPGNMVYANGHKFVARYFHLAAGSGVGAGGVGGVGGGAGTAGAAGNESVEPLQFQVDVANEAVIEVGTPSAKTAGGLGAMGLRAVPVCDVDLTHFSYISDDEEYRFQMQVAVYGYERGWHGGGKGFTWGGKSVTLRRAVRMRLVNVGASQLVGTGRLGYPVCTVCGQSVSPFSSAAQRDQFDKSHGERCGKAVQPTGFYADVVADALALDACANREEAYSVLECLRAGAAQVLDMELDDLQVLVIGTGGSEQAEAVLYDPMPGGSGLLDQIVERWEEVVAAAREIACGCPGGCARACIECLCTFRNAYYQKHLDRHVFEKRLGEWGARLEFTHEVPAKMPGGGGGGGLQVNEYEARLRDLMLRAGFPEAEWQKQIYLGPPLGSTTPDAFFVGEDQGDPGTCVYLDGLSVHIHGNAVTADRDKAIRETLRAKHYEVIEIPASDLYDKGAMSHHFFRLGRILVGKEKARQMRDEPEWFGH